MKLNHLGENKGRGQISWRSGQKERFNGGISSGYIAKEALIQDDLITEEEYGSVNVTTLTRVLDSSPGKNALSIGKGQSGELVFNDMKSLLKVYRGLVGKSVKDVYHDIDRKKFLNDVLGDYDDYRQGVDIEADNSVGNSVAEKRKTRRTNLKNKPIFGEKLFLKSGLVNDIYCDICGVYELHNKKGGYVEILGFSMRLILDTAAREYYKENPDATIKGDAVYRSYIKLIKENSTPEDVNTMRLNKPMADLISGENVEGLLGKLAHGAVHADIGMVLNLSYIIGHILNIHFSNK